MEQKSGTDAWNENTLKLKHGTELERKYASTDAQNPRNMERKLNLIYCPEKNQGFIEMLLCSM